MKVQSPRLPARLPPTEAPRLHDDIYIESVAVSDASYLSVIASNVRFDQVDFTKVSFDGARLDRLNLLDSTLQQCDLPTADCSRSSWTRVRFKGGRLTGLDLSQSTLSDVIFDGCKLDMSNFRTAKLTRVQFIDCMLSEVDFQGATLHDVELQGCQLSEADFTHAKLKNVDARGSDLFGVRGWQSLGGLTIDSIQLTALAPELANALGIVVKD